MATSFHDRVIAFFKGQDPAGWAEAERRAREDYALWRCTGCGLGIVTDEESPECDHCGGAVLRECPLVVGV